MTLRVETGRSSTLIKSEPQYSVAGNPDKVSLERFGEEVNRVIARSRDDLLSVIEMDGDYNRSRYLLDRREEIASLSIHSPEEYLDAWRPRQTISKDRIALGQGYRTPPHLEVLAHISSVEHTIQVLESLANSTEQLDAHFVRTTIKRNPSPTIGSKVSIGHGHSPVWRELKEFLEERLGLSVDEFNRVSTAGVPTATRLTSMLSQAGFAFLIMTGEDESNDGTLRARENVVHEVGLFQGRLGFEKAIVLLEEGCEEFSNIHGLGQIRFPKNNISAKFEEIRKVLEREGIIRKIAPNDS